MPEPRASTLPSASPIRREPFVAAFGRYLRLQSHGNRVLGLMLAFLHAAIVWGQGQAWGQAVVLAHYGLFLLWQPFFSGQQNLPWLRALGVLAVGVALAFLENIWTAALWAVLLAGLLGGGAVAVQGTRRPLAGGALSPFAAVHVDAAPRLRSARPGRGAARVSA